MRGPEELPRGIKEAPEMKKPPGENRAVSRSNDLFFRVKIDDDFSVAFGADGIC